MPTAVAIQWVEVTTPNVPSISGRVVKVLGLTLVMKISAFCWSFSTFGVLVRAAAAGVLHETSVPRIQTATVVYLSAEGKKRGARTP